MLKCRQVEGYQCICLIGLKPWIDFWNYLSMRLPHDGKISAKTAELKEKEEYKKNKALHLECISKVEKDYIKGLEDMEMKLQGNTK